MSANPPATPERQKAKASARLTSAAATAAFVACARCSFFLAAYRLIHDDFEPAIAASDGQALTLTWSEESRKLLEKSYGLEIETNCYHLEGLCPECWRPFAFDAVNAEDESFLRVWLASS